MRVEVAEEGQSGGSRVVDERALEGGDVCVLKCREELITEGSINVTAFVVLLTLFGMLADERLLVERGCPCQDTGCETGISNMDEWVLGDEELLSSCKDNNKVAVLAPATGTLDRRRVFG